MFLMNPERNYPTEWVHDVDEHKKRDIRRCRFIAHIADLSALGGFPTIRIILLISTIAPITNSSTLISKKFLRIGDTSSVTTTFLHLDSLMR